MSAVASTKNHSSAISSSTSRPRNPPKPFTQSSSFVFGSSTPREISYINKTQVSPQDRLLIDTEPRRKKPLPPVGDKDIIYYMRQARSIGPRGAGLFLKKYSDRNMNPLFFCPQKSCGRPQNFCGQKNPQITMNTEKQRFNPITIQSFC